VGKRKATGGKRKATGGKRKATGGKRKATEIKRGERESDKWCKRERRVRKGIGSLVSELRWEWGG
jgi:hypothetical protein